jgi:hypothetical protein
VEVGRVSSHCSALKGALNEALKEALKEEEEDGDDGDNDGLMGFCKYDLADPA